MASLEIARVLMTVVQFLLCKASLKETGRISGRLRWSERGMIIVAYSSQSFGSAPGLLSFPFFFMPPRKARSVVSMRRVAGSERTGSPSGRVIKPVQCVHLVKHRAGMQTRVLVWAGKRGVCRLRAKKRAARRNSYEFLTAPRWRDAFYSMCGVMHRPAYEDRPRYLLDHVWNTTHIYDSYYLF